ncbi:MAG: DUF485 domain-containing protein [Conchiformibius sp.]|nr:DUF485 domain-containing protein [Conchiformibius sp.]
MDKSKTPNHFSDEERLAKEVLAHPSFQAMAKQKALVGWSFSAVIFFIYVAYIWVIGTQPELLAAKVSPDGITTWGIYIGMFVIVFSFVITLVYVSIANGRFEETTQKVVREVKGEKS